MKKTKRIQKTRYGSNEKYTLLTTVILGEL